MPNDTNAFYRYLRLSVVNCQMSDLSDLDPFDGDFNNDLNDDAITTDATTTTEVSATSATSIMTTTDAPVSVVTCADDTPSNMPQPFQQSSNGSVMPETVTPTTGGGGGATPFQSEGVVTSSTGMPGQSGTTASRGTPPTPATPEPTGTSEETSTNASESTQGTTEGTTSMPVETTVTSTTMVTATSASSTPANTAETTTVTSATGQTVTTATPPMPTTAMPPMPTTMPSAAPQCRVECEKVEVTPKEPENTQNMQQPAPVVTEETNEPDTFVIDHTDPDLYDGPYPAFFPPFPFGPFRRPFGPFGYGPFGYGPFFGPRPFRFGPFGFRRGPFFGFGPRGRFRDESVDTNSQMPASADNQGMYKCKMVCK
ncbi:mucin-2-like isoform X1 [Paramacrobiotus metropolitanus]|uniref:mucin-2-like isoform X1 n=1 Tax=Paramacrobiotus metropolitanus TaxID=2943436 RepID=UPI002445E551|nr:mucin-2-like isoform X1 [Paramacrobiotus metropolitanus]